jgi:hypothetical protein
MGLPPVVGKRLRWLVRRRAERRARRAVGCMTIGPQDVHRIGANQQVHHWVFLPSFAAAAALPVGAAAGARQTKTPDLTEARGARIAQHRGQPAQRLLPGHRTALTVMQTSDGFMSCLLSVVRPDRGSRVHLKRRGPSPNALLSCITRTCDRQPLCGENPGKGRHQSRYTQHNAFRGGVLCRKASRPQTALKSGGARRRLWGDKETMPWTATADQ